MARKDLIAKAKEVAKKAREDSKIIPCGVNAANNARIATMMRTLERQQNG